MRTASDIIAEIAYDAYWDNLRDADGKSRRSDRSIQMKTLELVNAKLVNYERRNNSYYGNPSYFLCFTNGTETVEGKTASNASCGYSATSFRDGRLANVTYHITRAGNVIIDKIQEV